MKQWWVSQMHAWRTALGDIRRAPIAWLASAAVVASGVILPVLMHLAVAALAPAAREIAADPEVSVYLSTDASAGDFGEAQALITEKADALRGEINVARVAVVAVPKVEALKQFRAQAERAGNAAAFAALKDNPLPDGFVIRISGIPTARADQFAADLRKIPKVDAVQLDAEWVRRVSGAVEVVATMEWVLALLFAAVIVAVTFITTHAQVLASRDEIEVARLIGATNAVLRRPFVVRGALLGAVGAAIALSAAAAILVAVSRVFGPQAASIVADSAMRGIGVIALVAGLGAAGGWWSATRHLARMSA